MLHTYAHTYVCTYVRCVCMYVYTWKYSTRLQLLKVIREVVAQFKSCTTPGKLKNVLHQLCSMVLGFDLRCERVTNIGAYIRT